MSDMTETFEIFKKLQSTTKKNEKIEILKTYSANSQFINTLRWLLNPFILSGISNKKLNKELIDTPIIYYSIPNLLLYLKAHNTGKDVDIAIVQDSIRQYPKDEQEMCKQLITKTLKLGVDAKTVNSVYGNGFIPSFSIQLANKYFEHPDKVKGSFTLTEKLDGFRLATVAHNGEIKFYSRQGQLVEGLVEIEEEMKTFLKLIDTTDIFFDGELVAVNCESISSDENYKIVTKTARTKGIKRGLKYNIFDVLGYSDFVNQNCKIEYSKRRHILNSFEKAIKAVAYAIKLEHINILPVLYNGSDTSMIMKYLNNARDKHKEGVMINLDKGMYEFKRTNNLLKVKVMQDADLRIVDVYEGTGKNSGKLGGIIIEFVYENNLYRCECGSGFSDEERIDYWNNPNKILNKIATIQYFEISKNDDNGYGLRFPVWTHRIREDKTEISMN